MVMAVFGRVRGARSARRSRPSEAPPQQPAQESAVTAPAVEVSRLIHKPFDHSSVGLTLQSKNNQTTIDHMQPNCAAQQAGLCVGDVVKIINGTAVESATFGCALLQSAPAGFIEIVVDTTSPVRPVSPKDLQLPVKSAFDDEIELLPSKESAIPMYERELRELHDMGFTDAYEALFALRACNGNVQSAIERLLSASSAQ